MLIIWVLLPALLIKRSLSRKNVTHKKSILIPLNTSYLSVVGQNTKNDLVIKIKVHLLLFCFIEFCFASFSFESVCYASKTDIDLGHTHFSTSEVLGLQASATTDGFHGAA